MLAISLCVLLSLGGTWDHFAVVFVFFYGLLVPALPPARSTP